MTLRCLFLLLVFDLLGGVLALGGEKQAKLLEQVWKLVSDEYYDSRFNGVDWAASRQKYRPAAERANTDAEIYRVLGQMVGELKDAHTRVSSPAEVREERSRMRWAFGFTLRLVENQYIVERVEPQSAMAHAGVSRGWVLAGVDAARAPGSGDARAIAAWYEKAAIHEKCLQQQTVRFVFLDGKSQAHDVSAACTILRTTDHAEFRRLDGGALYVRFDRFGPAAGAWFGQTLAANRNATGLILDLRWNSGGLKSQLLKCLDELFTQPLSAGVDVTRKGRSRNWKVKGSGRRAFRKPVVVLVDQLTMSSSEILAAVVQETGRGKVVGRKTPGKVLLSYESALAGGGRLQLSVRDYRTEKGRRLEGEGVKPDEEVPLRAADLRNGVDRDIERALAALRPR